MLSVFHLVLSLIFKCFGVAISGLSFVCGKSWERCDWAFYSAACKLAKGIVHQSWIFHVIDMVHNLFKAYIKLCICQKIKNVSSLQRRKKSGKSGLTGNSAMLGKRFPTNAVGNKHESAPDPLLSLFINNMHFLDPKCIQQDECFRDDASDTSDVKR